MIKKKLTLLNLTLLPHKMPPTINELTVEVTKNAFGKMQYFFLFDRIDIV